ncbi:MAG: hypothetical protein WC645_01405 [Candidatus Margulisiibacteriota bacterium]|nr:hypothetical protein [Candidatus Saganbacteria bacterium]
MTCKPNGAESAVYGLGLIGALVYYIQHATSFWNGILGIIYSFFWPAFLVFKLLEFFKM